MREPGSKERIRRFLLANIGKVVTSNPNIPLLPINMKLDNDTKIGFGNAYLAMWFHEKDCWICYDYLHSGDGDLCEKGKEIICAELAFADTVPVEVRAVEG